MPIVEHSALPSFSRLREEGQEVLRLNRALTQDIRELHIGLLNMMPDDQKLRLAGLLADIGILPIGP